MTDGAEPRWRELMTADLGPRAALVVLGVWLNAADALVTATIMPTLVAELGGAAYYGWAVAIYLTGGIVAGASSGQLSRRFGLRPAMILAAFAYVVGCALSAAAPSIPVFLFGRILQGLGGGWIVGFCYIAIGQLFPERMWSRIFGILAGVWGIASLIGPAIGGAFATAGHWRGAFWLFAAQGVVFAGAGALLLTRVALQDASRPLAWRTLIALAVAISIIAAADVTPGAIMPAALLALGIVGLFIAARVNSAPGERLLPADAARPWTLVGAGYAMIFAMEVATVVLNVYEAAILQVAYRVTPLVAGYVVSVIAVGWTAAAFVVAGQPERRHDLLIRLGGGTITVGVALLAVTLARAALIWPILAGATVGVGFGLCWALITQRILGALSDADRAIGAGAVPTTQLIGGACGAAAAGAAANLLGLPRELSQGHVVAVSPWLCGAFVPVAILGWLAALRLARG